jgi:protein-tyrosine phosphatase
MVSAYRYGAYAPHAAASSRTSATDPLRVDWVHAGTSGRLGMTIAPGKTGSPSRFGYQHHRDLGADLDRLAAMKTKVLVSLIEDHELQSLGIPNLVAQAQERGIQVIRFPIPDLGTPNLQAAKTVVAKIAAALKDGKNVVVHCRGGNGRTGTIAACTLVALGKSPGQALATVRVPRPNAAETRGQEQFIQTFATS